MQSGNPELSAPTAVDDLGITPSSIPCMHKKSRLAIEKANVKDRQPSIRNRPEYGSPRDLQVLCLYKSVQSALTSSPRPTHYESRFGIAEDMLMRGIQSIMSKPPLSWFS